MARVLNNEIELDPARVALNAATRIIDAIQADTRMRALALASGAKLASCESSGYQFLESKERLIENESKAVDG